MVAKTSWFSHIREQVKNSPLLSNVVFGFILTGLEKLMELEFQCPCIARYNGVFSAAFFIVPAIMAFTLMLFVQGFGSDKQYWKTVLSSFVPAYIWLILLFLDGRYFACAMTNWDARFVTVDKAAPQKWCEPPSRGTVSQQLMLRSQQWMVSSQGIGIGLAIFIFVFSLLYLYCRKYCCPDKAKRRPKEPDSVELGTS